MTKRQFSLWLGLIGQAGCAVYEDELRRGSSDATTDVLPDGAAVARDVATESARVDVFGPDTEVSGDASPEAGLTEDVATVEDAREADLGNDARDAGDAALERDANVGMPPDASPPDAETDAQSDATADVDARDAGGGSDALFDAQSDPPIVGCTVDFTVSGVTWDEDGSADTGEGGSRTVRVVGDAGVLGAWIPSAGLTMVEKAPGAWSVTVTLADELPLEFKFVKMESGRSPEWEQWLPFDSNRSLLVDCAADGGPIWVDAATDAGPASRAVGRSYGGAFGVRPLDATK